MTVGTYTLVIQLPQQTTVTVGALGEMTFDSGWYAYTGSAFGPGGFARIDRHQELADGERDTRHWHIDYLLGETAASITEVYTTPQQDCECTVAGSLPGTPVAAFGASDCSCSSHLTYNASRAPLSTALTELHEEVVAE